MRRIAGAGRGEGGHRAGFVDADVQQLAVLGLLVGKEKRPVD
jgi:hypothetical protein